MKPFQQFISELRRRRVFRALVVYAVAAFAILQVVEPVMHGLHLPEWVLSLIVVLLGLGFPLTVGLAWAFDLKATGVERTRPPEAHPGGGARSRVWVWLLLLGVAAVAGGAVFTLRWWLRPPPAPPSIAVLPFADLSPNHDQEYFADGVAEEILNALAHVEGLRVPGRTSSFWFKGKDADLAEIGRKLNVTHVLEGSVRRAGTRLRVTAQVVIVADGYHLWSETFDRGQADTFAVQDEIANAVTRALRVKLLPPAERSKLASSTRFPEAHAGYLLAHQLILSGNRESTRRAVGILEKALAIDPSYVRAQTALATALGNLALTTRTEESGPLGLRAMEAAQRAVALGPGYALAYSNRGWLRAVLRWEWREARIDLERAVAMAPGDSIIRNEYSILLQKEGRLAEAVEQARRAVDLDPLDAVSWGNLGGYYTELGELSHAREALRRALEVSPGNADATYSVAVVDLLDGRAADALATFMRADDEAFRLRGVAVAQHALGNRAESDQALRALQERVGRDAPYEVALVHAWRGERDAAFEWLDRAYAQHDIGLRHVKIDPLLRGLRVDARWGPFLRKMNLPVD